MDTSDSYALFLNKKMHVQSSSALSVKRMPSCLFDFQQDLVAWSLRLGRSGVFADCGLGKTAIQLTWADNVRWHTNKPVLVLTPLAVGAQTVAEAEKFGIEDVARSRDGRFKVDQIVVTNYEQLHRFDPNAFGGVVCDESSILKHYRGATQAAVTAFLRKVPHRILCTATAAPNDYAELGTSSEALGVLGMVDMLSRFFRQDDKVLTIQLRKKERSQAGHVVAGTTGGWRLKGHAYEPFWKWVASWARAARCPSDVGPYSDSEFNLPPLDERAHIIQPRMLRPGELFARPAIGFAEEREERRRTIHERCELVSDLVSKSDRSVVWCHLNDEGDMLARLLPQCVHVSGADSDEEKERKYERFTTGDARIMVTKPKIGAWGLNWQHCAHVVMFASHSYEQYYQAVRRCWRFGQKRAVVVDVIATEGEAHVLENMQRKARQASEMFDALVRHMKSGMSVDRVSYATQEEVPEWLVSK